MKDKTRLTIDDRINLQAAIAKGNSLKDICKLLKKNRTTIYRELTHYYIVKESRQSCSHCSKLQYCRDNGIVFPRPLKACPDFIPARCEKNKKFPYVCNGCYMNSHCYNTKRYYDCTKAEVMSLQNRVSTRKRNFFLRIKYPLLIGLFLRLSKRKVKAFIMSTFLTLYCKRYARKEQ